MKTNWFCLWVLFFGANIALATSNHEYGSDEYDTVANGMSPDGRYAITAHGDGYLGYDHFHIFLTNAITGRKIGPLEEISEILDTGADAYCAKWSDDSRNVVILYRISRHEPLKAVSYHIAKGRGFPLKGPVDATDKQTFYWGHQCSQSNHAGKVFGRPKID
jgi:hypothetical protein